jgi:carotenoid 1,2-hydratase
MSDDRCHALTTIAFVGSVFSPYYARAQKQPGCQPLDHCALNVALYGEGGKRWAMTERRRAAVECARSRLTIGPSAIAWDGDSLTIRIDEVTFPLPSRIRGTLRLYPAALSGRTFALDADGRHRWSPLAPCARVEVELSQPSLRWAGTAYLDSNEGDEPLEQAFARWDWSRASLRDGTAILYDVERRTGDAVSLALHCDHAGRIEPFLPPARVDLATTGWRIARSTRADRGHTATLQATLEDTPFYARSLVSTRLCQQEVMAIHESLVLDRLRAAWVRPLLRFRMPRAWH